MANTNWISYWTNEKHDQLYWERGIGFFSKNLVQSFNISKDSCILDYGCGPGFLGKHLSGQVRKIVLADPSEQLLAQAQQNNMGLENIEIIKIEPDPTENKFPEQCYDIITINSIIQYLDLDTVANLLETLSPCLKENGKIIISDIVSSKTVMLSDVFFVSFYNWKWFGLGNLIGYWKNEFSKIKKRNDLKFYFHSKRDIESVTPSNLKISWIKSPTVSQFRNCAVIEANY